MLRNTNIAIPLQLKPPMGSIEQAVWYVVTIDRVMPSGALRVENESIDGHWYTATCYCVRKQGGQEEIKLKFF